MKTARQVLLDRHRSAEAKLDRIRESVLSALSEPEVAAASHFALAQAPLPVRALLKIWRELICPSRYAWGALAGLWLVLAAVNLGLRDHSQSDTAKSAVPSPELIIALWRQEQLLTELIEPRPARAALPAKPALPRPRSQRGTDSSAA